MRVRIALVILYMLLPIAADAQKLAAKKTAEAVFLYPSESVPSSLQANQLAILNLVFKQLRFREGSNCPPLTAFLPPGDDASLDFVIPVGTAPGRDTNLVWAIVFLTANNELAFTARAGDDKIFYNVTLPLKPSTN